MKKHQIRIIYIVLAALTVCSGLLSRSSLIPLPAFIKIYAGDTLWAALVFWLFCLCFRALPTWRIAGLALFFSFAVEFSQFYHAPWIDALRRTVLGGLILGFGFKGSDLVCYSVGIICASFIDLLIIRKQGHPGIT